MLHFRQRRFVKTVKRKFPIFFSSSNVINVGRLEHYGNSRYFFRKCAHIFIEADSKDNTADILKKLKEDYEYRYHGLISVDSIICTSAIEYDATWEASISAMYDLLRPGGLLLITVTSYGRREDADRNIPSNTQEKINYYHNIDHKFSSVLPASLFTTYYLNRDSLRGELQFYGIKKGLR